MIPKTKESGLRAASGGALAGVAAGALLTVMMTVMSAANGKDIWYGMKGAATPILGERAMAAGFDFNAVLLGLGVHFAISAAWGVLFAMYFYAAKRVATMIGGVVFGFVVWLGMYYLVLPAVGLESMTNEVPAGRAIMFHEIFSISLAAAYLAWQRIEDRIESRFTHHAPAIA